MGASPKQLDLQQLKVCFIAGTLGLGGAERQVFYAIQSLCEKGVQCRVLTLTQNEAYEEKIRKLGVPVIWVGRFGARALRAGRIVLEVAKWKPTIVQSAHFFTNLYSYTAATMTGSISIGAVRSEISKELNKISHWGRLSVTRPTLLVANSAQAAQETAQLGILPSSRIKLLDNVVDCNAFYPTLHKPSTSEPTDIRILAVGRLRQVKRHDILLRAYAIASKHIPDIKLTIAGDGPLHQELEELAVNLGIQDKVTFLGSVDDVLPLYQSSDFLVHCSDYEGSPNVILEAMACGLPVIATRAGASASLVQDQKTGFLTEIQAIDAIADKIAHLSFDLLLRNKMGATARQVILEHHALSNLGNELLKLYEYAFAVRAG